MPPGSMCLGIKCSEHHTPHIWVAGRQPRSLKVERWGHLAINRAKLWPLQFECLLEMFATTIILGIPCRNIVNS